MSRADRVNTTKVVANCIICVPKKEEREYKEFNPNNEIVVHPDTLKGLSLKRQWIYEKFGDCFMIDDDAKNFYRNYHKQGMSATCYKAIDVYNIIQSTYNISKNMNVYLYGFADVKRPFQYHGFKPFQLTGYIMGGSIGLNSGSKLFFNNEQKVVEDYWVSCLNAYYHRKIFKDLRFAFAYKDTMKNEGGVANYRTMEQEKKDTLFLRRMFGEVVNRKPTQTLAGTKFVAKAINRYARNISIPF